MPRPYNPERYARHLSLPGFGADGQRRLREASVLVTGLGGLGSPVSLYLAAAGVGRMLLADADTVSLSNLQRQVLYSEAEVGKPKAECAARRLLELNSEILLEPVAEGLTAENAPALLAGCDLVLDCTDNWSTRFLIDDFCAGAGVPWVFGSMGEWAGMVSLFGGPSRHRLADLFPEREELCSRPAASGGVIGALPGIVGAAQACAALEHLALGSSPLDGRLWTFDARTFQSQIIDY